jgi:hypothetical protein
MNNTTKKIVYNNKKELFVIRVRIKSLEKNPIKGGTPAIENKSIVVKVR